MYFCLCCGYQTLYEKPPGTYFVCPICFWTDVDADYGIIRELRQAQLNYVNKGASDSLWLDQVCPPSKQDIRTPNWKLLDEEIREEGEKVKNVVIMAFENVQREEGISLHEADMIANIVDYDGPSCFFKYDSSRHAELLAKAREKDVEDHWKNIPYQKLEQFFLWTISYYLDPQGWRYYLPAYLVWLLNKYIDNQDTFDGFRDLVEEFLLLKRHRVLKLGLRSVLTSSVVPVPRLHERLNYQKEDFDYLYRRDYFVILSSKQLSAINQFLEFGLTYEWTDKELRQGIENWRAEYQ